MTTRGASAARTKRTGWPRPARRFDMEDVLATLRAAAPTWNAPVVTLIATQTQSPFHVLVSCLLSLRTKDETTAPASRRLFALAETPEAMRRLSVETIEQAIFPVGFYRNKARQILGICEDLLARYGGQVPADLDELLTLKGVGRKTANLVLTQGFGLPAMCVDTHVHRISNRWGYVRTKTPLDTEMVLRRKLPKHHWPYYNDLLVAFGQTICHPTSPRCSVCPVVEACPRKGVVRCR